MGVKRVKAYYFQQPQARILNPPCRGIESQSSTCQVEILSSILTKTSASLFLACQQPGGTVLALTGYIGYRAAFKLIMHLLSLKSMTQQLWQHQILTRHTGFETCMVNYEWYI